MNDPQDSNPPPRHALEPAYQNVVPARPAAWVYSARPVTTSPVFAFPTIDMRRRPAGADVLLVMALLVVLFFSPPFQSLLQFLENWSPTHGPLLSNTAIGAVVVLLVTAILEMRRQSPASVGLDRPKISHALTGAAAVPACYLVIMITGVLFILISGDDVHSVIDDKQALIDIFPDFSVSTVLLFGVFTGFFEELLFRGLLLTRFNALVRNRALAIVLSALLFGLVHVYQGPMGVVQTASIGIVLGTVATLTRSIWPAIIAHAAFNSAQFALLPFAAKLLDEASRQAASMPA